MPCRKRRLEMTDRDSILAEWESLDIYEKCTKCGEITYPPLSTWLKDQPYHVWCITEPPTKTKKRRLMSDTEPLKKKKMFPIMSRPGDEGHPTKIAWEIADYAYSHYKARYGTDQSLERLAERGGFSVKEMDMYYPNWRKDSSDRAKDKEEIAELKAVLRMHHDWQQDPDTQIMLGDELYNLDACYVDSTLEERTTKALKGS